MFRIHYQVRRGNNEYVDQEGRWGSILSAFEFANRRTAELVAAAAGGEVCPVHDIQRTMSGEFEVPR